MYLVCTKFSRVEVINLWLNFLQAARPAHDRVFCAQASYFAADNLLLLSAVLTLPYKLSLLSPEACFVRKTARTTDLSVFL